MLSLRCSFIGLKRNISACDHPFRAETLRTVEWTPFESFIASFVTFLYNVLGPVTLYLTGFVFMYQDASTSAPNISFRVTIITLICLESCLNSMVMRWEKFCMYFCWYLLHICFSLVVFKDIRRYLLPIFTFDASKHDYPFWIRLVGELGPVCFVPFYLLCHVKRYLRGRDIVPLATLVIPQVIPDHPVDGVLDAFLVSLLFNIIFYYYYYFRVEKGYPP